jgi:hypothetical protein
MGNSVTEKRQKLIGNEVPERKHPAFSSNAKMGAKHRIRLARIQ